MEFSSESVEKPVKRKLRWYQFSLRSLLIFVTLFAVACSWFAVKMGQAKRQREAVETIRKLGGEVYYDYQMYGNDGCDLGDCCDKPRSPNPFSKQLGIDFFHSIHCIFCRGSEINDAILEPIKSLPDLVRLDLRETKISDSGLQKRLGDMPNLKCLIIEGTPIGDEGLRNINGLEHLRVLDLSKTKVTDKGMKCLKGLSALQILFLDDTKITMDGIKELRQALPGLEIRPKPR